jgi:hypothetical protein
VSPNFTVPGFGPPSTTEKGDVTSMFASKRKKTESLLSETVLIQITPSDKRRLHEAARADQRSVSSFVRKAVDSRIAALEREAILA